jgi:hypothetical protein
MHCAISGAGGVTCRQTINVTVWLRDHACRVSSLCSIHVDRPSRTSQKQHTIFWPMRIDGNAKSAAVYIGNRREIGNSITSWFIDPNFEWVRWNFSPISFSYRSKVFRGIDFEFEGPKMWLWGIFGFLSKIGNYAIPNRHLIPSIKPSHFQLLREQIGQAGSNL